ncbi:MAG: hypothetical protein LAO09_08575 [Acidobacteriia bacterium]|nr:hypothetical protein [Terriglobia bacterium]
MELRKEPRFPVQLTVFIWGVDATGVKFAQVAQVRNVSGRGALLCGIEQPLRPEDLIGVQYRQRRAKFRVVWLRDSRGPEKILAAVERLKAEACPWPEEVMAVSKAPHGAQGVIASLRPGT